MLCMNYRKLIAKARSPPSQLLIIENEEEFDDIHGEGTEKVIIPSFIIDSYTILKVLQGLILSGHTDTFSEACNL